MLLYSRESWVRMVKQKKLEITERCQGTRNWNRFEYVNQLDHEILRNQRIERKEKMIKETIVEWKVIASVSI